MTWTGFHLPKSRRIGWSTAELATVLGMYPKTIERLARRGVIPAVRLGPRGHWRFRPADLRAILGHGWRRRMSGKPA